MTDLTNLLAPFKARAEAATKGPFELIRYPHGGGRMWTTKRRILVADTYSAGDREFLFHARTDVPRLLAALEGVLALADAYEAKANDYDNSAERFVPGEVRSRYKSMAEDEREHAAAIRAAVVAALGEGT